jgi:hypothetical protein
LYCLNATFRQGCNRELTYFGSAAGFYAESPPVSLPQPGLAGIKLLCLKQCCTLQPEREVLINELVPCHRAKRNKQLGEGERVYA